MLVVVNHTSQLSPLGELIADSLTKIDTYESTIAAQRSKETIHIPTVGSRLSTAYEQLRNASEYAEDNLLRQRAIRRYLRRVLSFHEYGSTKQHAHELVTELTQAEYLPNNHLTQADIKAIATHIKRYYKAYWQYTKIETSSSKRLKFQEWVLDVLSVRCEQVLESNIRQLSFAHFAYTYLQPKVDIATLVRKEQINPVDYPLVLYMAIQRSLLKSDNASIRAALLDSYRQDISLIHNFEAFNLRLDALFESKTVAFASRIISRNGATLRMIYSGFYTQNAPISLLTLRSEDTLDYALRQHIEQEYADLNRRLDKGIMRSIVFLLITKSIIGLGVEVPYDILVEGHILWLPLILNLFFPVIYIIVSRSTLSTPTLRNTDAIVEHTKDIFYSANDSAAYPIKVPRAKSSAGFNVLYASMFVAVFVGLSYLLMLLQFNIVQGVIFFIFLSTASFLAFRLSNQVREVEALTLSQGSLSLLRDVIYMPFIYVGQQISYRYSRVNIIALILDIVIELPLKTVLRLTRQWTQFLNSKKDEML